MIEALAHKCALLSSVNPDGLVERFGYYAKNDDFEKGLNWLLESDRWRRLGEEGYKYVKDVHSLNVVMNKLIKNRKKHSLVIILHIAFRPFGSFVARRHN